MRFNILRYYAICGAFVFANGFAQMPTGSDAAPRFAVASVKPCTARAFDEFATGGRGTGAARPVSVDPERIRINCMPLESIIMQAYVVYASGQSRSVLPTPLPEQWVRGGPRWIESAYYAIDGKPEAAQTAAIMLGPMLQALLEERFKLSIHRETKEMTAYALVVAKGGLKLKATKEGSCTPVDLNRSPLPPLAPGQPPPCGSSSAGRDGLLKAQGWSMANLCRFLTRRLNQKVVDKTGITGVFDIIDVFNMRVDLERPSTLINMADESNLTAPDPTATIEQDLQKLGLRLESTKDATEFVVIDHIERPSAN
jgi:uncharacterized protein (TIGR03435 family)